MAKGAETQCSYRGNDTGGQRCTRSAVRGWTTCGRHYSAGRAKRAGKRGKAT